MTTSLGLTELGNLVLSYIVGAARIGFLGVASATLVFYDYFLTFDQEVSRYAFQTHAGLGSLHGSAHRIGQVLLDWRMDLVAHLVLSRE